VVVPRGGGITQHPDILRTPDEDRRCPGHTDAGGSTARVRH